MVHGWTGTGKQVSDVMRMTTKVQLMAYNYLFFEREIGWVAEGDLYLQCKSNIEGEFL